MASSLVHFKGYGFWVVDQAAQVLLAVIRDEAYRLDQRPEWLSGLVKSWEESSLIPAGGAVIPWFDENVGTDEAIELMIALCERALARFVALGSQGVDSIYLSQMGIHLVYPHEDFGAFVSHLELITRETIKLFRGESSLPISASKKIAPPHLFDNQL